MPLQRFGFMNKQWILRLALVTGAVCAFFLIQYSVREHAVSDRFIFQRITPEDLSAFSDILLTNIGSSRKQTTGQSLYESIKHYDNALESGNFAEVYGVRTTQWKAIVPQDKAEHIFRNAVTQVHKINTLAILPLPKVVGSDTSGYLVSRLAFVDLPTGAGQWISYIETWVQDENTMALTGGAPWDQPALPVLSVRKN